MTRTGKKGKNGGELKSRNENDNDFDKLMEEAAALNMQEAMASASSSSSSSKSFGTKKATKNSKPASKEMDPTEIDLSGDNKVPLSRGLNPDVQCDSFTKTCAQTWPPTKPVEECFKSSAEYPKGEEQPHPGDFNRFRTTKAELRDMERLYEDLYRKVRLGAEVHRQVRKWAQSWIKPGIRLIDMCELIENKNRELVKENGLQAGIGFPTGCSLNHVAAHYTPNTGDETVLGYNDVMKVDFGVQIEGRIIDSAWTVAFNPMFDPLIKTVRDATDAGLRAAGIDVRLCDVGEQIQEVMEAGEVEINGKVHQIKSIRNLCGHNILPYNIHAGKSVPMVKNGDTTKMEEGEFYAIETFGSTGRGFVIEDMECSHYMKVFDAPRAELRMPQSKKLLTHINKTYSSLAFCRRWLEREDGGSYTVNKNNGKQERYLGALKNLCDVGLVQACPPFVDVKGSYVAQFEHTFVLRPTCKEILSRGDDF